MSIRIIAVAMLILSMTGFPATAADEQRTVEGVVTAVNTTKNTITVRSDETRRLNTYFIEKDVAIYSGGKLIPLSGIKKGQTVALNYQATDSGRNVISFGVNDPDRLVDVTRFEVESEGVVTGEITGIRLANRSMTIKDDVTGERRTFNVAEDVVITRDDRQIRLRDLNRGDRIAGRFMFTEEGLMFVTERTPVAAPAKPAPAPAPAPVAAAPEVVAAPVAMLPKTASNRYLVLFVALGLLVAAGSVRFLRLQTANRQV